MLLVTFHRLFSLLSRASVSFLLAEPFLFYFFFPFEGERLQRAGWSWVPGLLGVHTLCMPDSAYLSYLSVWFCQGWQCHDKHLTGSDLSPTRQLNAAELLQEQGWQELFPGAGRDSGEGRPNPGPSLPKAVRVTWHETSKRCLSSVSGSVCEPV